MNKIFLTGFSARDVKLETSNNGTQFARINLAVARRFDKDKTDWFNCTVFGALAEKVASVYVKKGTKLTIVGRIEFNEQEKDGNKVKHHSVIVEEIELHNSNKSDTNNNGNNATPKAELTPVDDDSLPF